uniref:Troponin T n=1 Tax=Globodera rostochiensis TaxID=31243 RepID=A0A914H479_GLORO
MSEEEYSEEEVEVEEDVEEVSQMSPTVKAPPESKRLVSSSRDADDGEDNLNEAEKAMLAAKKRVESDDAAKLQDYEERRRVERDQEEEELRILREKQEQRRIQREEEERELEERRKAEEERRRVEEEERKARIEAERKKKEEDKKKRHHAMMGVGFGGTPTGGRNFVLPEKKKEPSDKFGNIVQAKQEMGMTKDQREEAKKTFIAHVLKNLGDLGSKSGAELKGKVKEMHNRICKLEAEKYDLEKRVQTQEYDLRELNERQRQINRAKMQKKGLDPNNENSRFPPKVAISSKYDRQIDRRNFKERRAIYDKKNAFPCFPHVPPPATILEYRLMVDEPASPRPDGEVEEEEEEEEEEE